MQPFDESLRGRNDTPEVTPEVTGEVPCKTDPRAPHGFDRNASHSADRYVCECEGWEPVDNVETPAEDVDVEDEGRAEFHSTPHHIQNSAQQTEFCIRNRGHFRRLPDGVTDHLT